MSITSSLIAPLCTLQVAILIPLILFHCLVLRLSVWQFPGHNLGLLTVSYGTGQVVCLSPNPQPGGPVHRIYKSRGKVAQLYPQAPVTHCGRLLRPTWAAVGPFLSLVTTRGKNEYKISYFVCIKHGSVCALVIRNDYTCVRSQPRPKER
jgi:hypothetical protein